VLRFAAIRLSALPSITPGDFVIYNASVDIAGCMPLNFSLRSFWHTSYRSQRRIERTRR
jgi:hypothetical protein